MRFVVYIKFEISFFFVRRQIISDGSDTDWREILHDGRYCMVPDRFSPLLGAVPQEIPKIQNFGRLKSEYP